MTETTPPSPSASANRPAILAVDDDAGVLHAVVRDLRHRYADRYRVLQAGGGAEALETLRDARTRNLPVALIVADQRMPGIDGVSMLAEARPLYPDAKAVLLPAYADTDAAALPLVVLPDGRVLRDPSVGELAAALGLTTRVETVSYDVAIVGAGPAGLAAAVYAASEGLRAAVVEREAPGGQAGQSSRIE